MPDAGVHARRRLLIFVGSPTHHPAGAHDDGALDA
jgi:hypothetical protein